MFDMHYDLLSVAYCCYLKKDYSYLEEWCKAYRDNNVRGVVGNLYFMSVDEMREELHPNYYREDVSVCDMFRISTNIIKEMLPETEFMFSIEGCDFLEVSDLEELYDILSKRTIFLAKRQLKEPNPKIDEWFEKEYYPFMIRNADKCVVLHDHYIGSEYDARVNDIADNILEFKRKVFLNLENIVLTKEFLTISSLIIASNVTMYAKVLEMNLTNNKKIELLKEIDKYNIAGFDAIFKEIIK